MENENVYAQEEVVEQEEQTLDTEETTEEQSEEDSESVTISKDELKSMKRKAMAYDANKSKPKTENITKPNINNNQIFQEELKLVARGYSDEEVEKAKVIAKGNGSTLAEAIKDEMFTSWKKTVDETKAKEESRLGASKGSGETKDEVDFQSGLTDEQHKELWKKNN